MKRKQLIVLILCIMLILSFIMLTSYAYWRVQKTQTGTNDIAGACLNISLVQAKDSNNNPIEGFTLENAWPVTDEEGIQQSGYTFKISNNCANEIRYQVVIDYLPSTGGENFDPDYIKIQLDNGGIRRYGSLSDAPNENLNYETIGNKAIFTGTIPASYNYGNNDIKKVEHNIKMWVAEDAPNSEIGHVFKSKVRVIAGQGLPEPKYHVSSANCFSFDSEKQEITGINLNNCSGDRSHLVIPATIDGKIVKSIDTFDEEQAMQTYLYNPGNNYINFNHFSQMIQSLDLTEATGLETIGSYSFFKYEGYGQTLIIPDSVKTIEKSAFFLFRGKNIIIGQNVEMIDNGAFINYTGTNQELIIPDSVIIIADDAFKSFGGSNLILGRNIESIGKYSFCNYVGTGEELIISDSVKTIDSYAFEFFNGSNLTLGRGLQYLGDSSFRRYVGENQSLTIPSTINYIGNVALIDYIGEININMTAQEFSTKEVSGNWKNSSASVNYLLP